ncbi:MAG TPA: hypothetical protein VM870_11340, partial [Pyrinomonadaceae bacterium]|nr:hypothetical protein [Pyrinomonadaceae bacterium]
MYLLVIGAALIGGTLLTYSFDHSASLPQRLCLAAFLGFCPLGLVCLVLASFFGLTTPTIIAASLITLTPLALLRGASVRANLVADLRKTIVAIREMILLRDRRALGELLFFTLLAALCWRFFHFAVEERPDGIFTGVDNNYFDLPVHLGIIYGFLDGNNFPPIHPEYAGARLTYPFLIDFLAAVLMRGGMSLAGAIFFQNMVFALAMAGVMYRWARQMTKSALAALLSVVLILFNGGAGWWLLAEQAWREGWRKLP